MLIKIACVVIKIMLDKPQSGRKYLHYMYLKKGLFPQYIKNLKKKKVQVNKKKKTQKKERVKYLNRYHFKKDIQMASEHITKGMTLLIFRKIHINK